MFADKQLDAAAWFANLTMLPDALGQPEMMGHYWTLETELVFYLLCIVLVLAGRGPAHARSVHDVRCTGHRFRHHVGTQDHSCQRARPVQGHAVSPFDHVLGCVLLQGIRQPE